ncbi:response regulator [Serinicoccus chungangensis]|uniref:response regulator n=1 Tax=Serinicoccus chungangensis TaxID=767452 RepID=UPI00111812E9|nr:response regulator transcription factor [Serinicoccus chungangensis]
MDIDVAARRDCAPLTGPPARVVLVDDHHMIRAGLGAALGEEPDLLVCGVAPDGLTGTAVVLRERPDVVLMDIAMPVMNGVDATASILEQWPQAKVVILTAFAEKRLVGAAMAAGAFGFVLKDADPFSVVCAVRRAMRGVLPVGEEMSHLPTRR